MFKSVGIFAGILLILGISSSFAATNSVKGSWSNWLEARGDSAQLKTRWSPDHSRIESVQGVLIPSTDSRTLEQRVSALADEVRGIHDMKPSELASARKSGTQTRRVYRYAQLYEGLSVEGHALVITVRKDGAIVGMENGLSVFQAPATEVKVTPEAARVRALAALDPTLSPANLEVTPALIILPVNRVPVRVWRVPVAALPHGFYTIYVRADDGKVLWVRNQMIH